MKKVLLICENGISSHYLVKAAQPFIELYDAHIQLNATDIAHAASYSHEDVELVLVAPQATYHDEELHLFNEDTPVETIPDEIYGWGNGEKLVKLVMEKLSPVEAA
ncbi:PTS lactose transporter subunit IIB [Lentilactobacillus otakiensis]|uniref:PTS lactose transporter subunit IIB n=1 Tax=Lentilactobacillus otakiensis TaxID=481720 RepID=UPI003D1693B6